jgi:iron complex outermembrane receptor protein
VAAYTATRSRDRGYAWAVQDFLRFLDERLVLAAGARYDSFEYEEHQTDLRLGTPTRTQKIEPSNWTYNYGVVGKPLAGVSVFFNHSETFNLPSPLINVTTGQVFKNLYGESDEYGVKLDLWKNKLTATGSVFEIVQNNQVVNAVNQPGVSVQQGVTKARGYELDLVFQPIREVSLIIGYGWMDSVASSNSATLVRNQRVPQGASYKAFGKYSFLSGPLKGFDVGAGYEFINDRAGDAADGFNVAPYHTYDAFAGYRLNSRFRVQLNVQNLTDEIYVQGAVSRQLVHPGNERNFRFSVRYQF